MRRDSEPGGARANTATHMHTCTHAQHNCKHRHNCDTTAMPKDTAADHGLTKKWVRMKKWAMSISLPLCSTPLLMARCCQSYPGRAGCSGGREIRCATAYSEPVPESAQELRRVEQQKQKQQKQQKQQQQQRQQRQQQQQQRSRAEHHGGLGLRCGCARPGVTRSCAWPAPV